ncbi:hypothetical protein M0802_010668 [Mischocyttarus mexicanus]|nr:hypothetical protein M0802_010668 [Mischocyttarus mexicanus]
MTLLVALAGITMTRRSEFSKVKSRRCLNGLETMPCRIVGNVSLHPKVLNAFSGGVGPACCSWSLKNSNEAKSRLCVTVPWGCHPLGTNLIGTNKKSKKKPDGSNEARESTDLPGPTLAMFDCDFSGCGRAFASSRGLSVHRQRMHKDCYDAEQLRRNPSKKMRWTEEEVALLANREAALVMKEGVRFMSQALHEQLPLRSMESIKGQRKRPEYKEMVQAAIERLKRQVVSQPAPF